MRINKARGLTKDSNQRARSFLYASLAATIAAMLGLNRIAFFENGVTSLNLPLSGQVVGSRASRTTHPRALQAFGGLFGLIRGKPFAVVNPYQDKTKADVIRVLTGNGCADLIGLTWSCALPRAASFERPHCGVCSQCIDRRFAVLAARAADHDPLAAYRVDVVAGEVPEGKPRTMLAVYTETARQVGRMTSSRFFARFGEVARALPFLSAPNAVAGQRVYDLYRRHGQEVREVVLQALRDYAIGFLDRTLPPHCLVRMATDDSGVGLEAEPPARPAPSSAASCFRRAGAAWQLRFDGRTPFILLPSLGAAYLHVLLQRAGRPMALAELAQSVAKDPDRFALAPADVNLDRQGLIILRARLRELDAAIGEAERDNDTVLADVWRHEKSEVLEELRKSASFQGLTLQQRDPSKQLRSAVYMAVRRALRDIAEYDAKLADHLLPKSANLRCGNNPCYDPRPPVIWDTDPLSGAQL